MTKPNVLRALSSLERDACIVTSHGAVARATEALGRRTLLQGRDWQGMDLRDRWSELSRRGTSAMVIDGSTELGQNVTRYCEVTHMNKENSAKRARRWAEHLLRNLLLLAEKPHAMQRGAFAGQPAFIVGAGPSLDKNGVLLPECGGVVIRVNAASKAVSGHVTFSVESNDLTHKLSEGGAQVLAITAPPHVLRCRYNAIRPVWCGEIAWIPELVTGVPRLAMSGSGSTAAVSLAHLWGCDPIVLVGHDLAFTDGKVYATSTGHRDSIAADGRYVWGKASSSMPRAGNPLPEQEQLQDAVAWGGSGTVKTGMLHHGVSRWMQVMREHMGVRCINATEGGARIDGWDELPLRDLLQHGSKLTVKDVAMGCAGELTPREDIVDWMRNDAAEALAEAWAYRELYDRIMEHQSSPPDPVPYREARIVRQAMSDVKDIVSRAEREIRLTVVELCRQ